MPKEHKKVATPLVFLLDLIHFLHEYYKCQWHSPCDWVMPKEYKKKTKLCFILDLSFLQIALRFRMTQTSSALLFFHSNQIVFNVFLKKLQVALPLFVNEKAATEGPCRFWGRG